MFTTKITINNKEYQLRFGSWVVVQVQKKNQDKENVSEVDMFIDTVFFGLIQGENLRSAYIKGEELPFDEFIIYDWLDEVGFDSVEVERVSKVIMAHATNDVPKTATEKSKNSKATTPKK